MNDAHEQLRAHDGPVFLRWRIGMALSVGAMFPELLERPEVDTSAEAA